MWSTYTCKFKNIKKTTIIILIFINSSKLGALLASPSGFALGLEIRQDIIDLAISNTNCWKEKHLDEDFSIEFELRNCFLVDPQGKSS